MQSKPKENGRHWLHLCGRVPIIPLHLFQSRGTLSLNPDPTHIHMPWSMKLYLGQEARCLEARCQVLAAPGVHGFGAKGRVC